jgi:glutamine amidotransferase
MIAIVNTGVANIASVLYALERLGEKAIVSDSPEQISKSDRVIIPGVGTAAASMVTLKKYKLDECVRQLTQPVLGICLGMQILYSHSQESINGLVACIGVLPGTIQKLAPQPALPVPHMGWNQVKTIRDSRLLKNIPNASNFYYVHSFRAPTIANASSEIVAISDYAETIPAVIEYKNYFGTQFHPERSGAVGEQLLKNFLAI